MNTCLIHQQMYWEYCPQCGPPLTLTTVGTMTTAGTTKPNKRVVLERPVPEPKSEARGDDEQAD